MDIKSTQTIYAFILGRERELCLAELKAILHRFAYQYDIFSVADNIVYIKIDELPENVAKIIDIAAGVTKIFEIKLELDKNIAKQIVGLIENSTKEVNSKINFGLSSYTKMLNENALNVLGLKIKKILKTDHSVRFVAVRGAVELATIVSVKDKLVTSGFEFGIFDRFVGELIAVNNPEPWAVRDYEKPCGDKFSGMLPPKLARTMLNLALGCHSRLKAGDLESKTLVLDPFCGSGNTVLEAITLGLDIFGSDISEKAVEDTKENTEWLLKSIQLKSHRIPKTAIMLLDVTKPEYFDEEDDFTEESHIHLMDSGFDMLEYDEVIVVAEPYLGEPKKFKPSLNAARGEYEKVKKLYMSFLETFTMAPYSLPTTFSIVFPLVETVEGKRFSLYRDCIDEIVKMGYIEVRSPLIYGRDYQVVKREIALLTLK